MFGTIVLALLGVYLFNHFYWKRRKLPPGPTPLPFIGNMMTINKCAPGYDAYTKWSKEFGPVYTFWQGTMPVIAVTDYELMKEAFIKDGDKYSDRHVLEELRDMLRGGNYGVITNSGEMWREQRRFAIHTLKDFGMGKNLMEERVMVEVDALLERLSSTDEEKDVQMEMDIAIGSIINNILLGYRFDEDKLGEFIRLKEMNEAMMKSFTNIRFIFALLIPILRQVPGFNVAWQQVFKSRDALYTFFRKQIKEKKQEVDVKSEGFSDFVECFLKKQHKRKNEEDFGGYSDQQLENIIHDLWVAGLETTSATLCWGICFILNHPEVQKKLHEELDAVIQSDRRIVNADKNRLPYMNAFICEVQRLGNIFPQNLFRKNSEDVVIGGHKIEKGSCICPQISVVLYDDKFFPEPSIFIPERFLNEDGNLKKVDELTPFSIGKRQCLGEGMARLELFLFFANLLQKFKIQSETAPTMAKSRGVTSKPQPFKCKFVERNI